MFLYKTLIEIFEAVRPDLFFLQKDTKQISTKPTHPQLNKKWSKKL